jgi:hypothetical protein
MYASLNIGECLGFGHCMINILTMVRRPGMPTQPDTWFPHRCASPLAGPTDLLSTPNAFESPQHGRPFANICAHGRLHRHVSLPCKNPLRMNC